MPRTGFTAEKVRSEAVKAAESRIRRHGFDKIRLVDVAAELGVSHAALYNHFPDKSALLDCVSEKWLETVDQTLAEIARKDEPPLKLIVKWFLVLHRLKRQKVLRDPELYRAFDFAAGQSRPFIVAHLKQTHDQLLSLVERALKSKQIKGRAEEIVQLLFESTMAFHHPRLVAENIHAHRERILKRTVETVLRGLS